MIAPIPFLWLCGPSGIGKSTVGFEIYRQLGLEGRNTAFVDADQLGLTYPAPADDPVNHRVKARNLGAVWQVLRARGIDSLVLSGVIESADHISEYAGRVPGAAVTLCRLRADRATLIERFVNRGFMTQLAEENADEAEEMDRLDFAELCVDTGGMSVTEAARLVRERAADWPSTSDTHPHEPPPATVSDPVPVLLLCGPAAVGKSTVGYQVFTQLRQQAKAAYVDLAQIGFSHPAPAGDPDNHRLKAANLAAMWPGFRDAGAHSLVVTGRVSDAAAIQTYLDAFPAMELTVCRLHACAATLTERIMRRGSGGGPAIPGDELRGMPEDVLRRAAELAAREADRLHDANLGDFWVGTDGRSVQEVAGLIVREAARGQERTRPEAARPAR